MHSGGELFAIEPSDDGHERRPQYSRACSSPPRCGRRGRQRSRILRFPHLRVFRRLYRARVFSFQLAHGQPARVSRRFWSWFHHAPGRWLRDRQNGRPRGPQAGDDSLVLVDGHSYRGLGAHPATLHDRRGRAHPRDLLPNAARICAWRRGWANHGVSAGGGASRTPRLLHRIPGLDPGPFRLDRRACGISARQRSHRSATGKFRLARGFSGGSGHRTLRTDDAPPVAGDTLRTCWREARIRSASPLFARGDPGHDASGQRDHRHVRGLLHDHLRDRHPTHACQRRFRRDRRGGPVWNRLRFGERKPFGSHWPQADDDRSRHPAASPDLPCVLRARSPSHYDGFAGSDCRPV